MHSTPFNLVKAGRRTECIYRKKEQYLADLNSENICAQFDSLEAARDAARARLVSDPKAIFLICNAEGRVDGRVADELLQKRKNTRDEKLLKISVALVFLLSFLTYVQFLGFQLMPIPLYFALAILVSGGIIYSLIAFPWDTKIILGIFVLGLMVCGSPIRESNLRKRKPIQKEPSPNQPAPGKTGIASGLTLEDHRPGLPELIVRFRVFSRECKTKNHTRKSPASRWHLNLVPPAAHTQVFCRS